MITTRRTFVWFQAALSVVSLFVVVAEIAIFSSPATNHQGSLGVSVRTIGETAESTSLNIQVVHGTADKSLRVVAFPLSSSVTTRAIYVYNDLNYPTASADPNLGLLENLAGQLYIDRYPRPVVGVDAKGLEDILTATSLATDRTVVLMTGVLPATVFSKRVDLLTPWVSAGGLVISGGATLGYYSGVPKRQLSDSAALSYGESGPAKILGSGVATFPWAYERPSTSTSPIGAALNISFSFASAGIRVGAAVSRHGLILGSTTPEFSSVTYLPSGAGGIVVFGGEAIDPEQISHDISQLVVSNATGGQGQVTAKDIDLTAIPRESNILWQLPFAYAKGGIMVFAFDPDPDSAFSFTKVLLPA